MGGKRSNKLDSDTHEYEEQLHGGNYRTVYNKKTLGVCVCVTRVNVPPAQCVSFAANSKKIRRRMEYRVRLEWKEKMKTKMKIRRRYRT